MTYVKRAQSGGVEITSAALTLSGLEKQEFLEVQTLNGAVVLFSADAERHELAGIVNELVRLAEAIITDVLDEEEAEQEIDSVPFPKAILENAGLNGNEYHVFSDKGIVMIVGKDQDFSLSPETRECLHEHGITPEHFDCLVNQSATEGGKSNDCELNKYRKLLFDTAVNMDVLCRILKEKGEALGE